MGRAVYLGHANAIVVSGHFKNTHFDQNEWLVAHHVFIQNIPQVLELGTVLHPFLDRVIRSVGMGMANQLELISVYAVCALQP